jgi:hypothetical protein
MKSTPERFNLTALCGLQEYLDHAAPDGTLATLGELGGEQEFFSKVSRTRNGNYGWRPTDRRTTAHRDEKLLAVKVRAQNLSEFVKFRARNLPEYVVRKRAT